MGADESIRGLMGKVRVNVTRKASVARGAKTKAMVILERHRAQRLPSAPALYGE